MTHDDPDLHQLLARRDLSGGDGWPGSDRRPDPLRAARGDGHFYELFGWNRHDIGQVHFYLAVAAVGLLALHVLLHWSWVCCVVGKAVGRETPSRRAQTTWGLVLLLGIALFLIGGLWWASIMVQKTAPEERGRGRRANLENMASGEPATTARKSEEPVAPLAASPPSSATSISRSVDGEGTSVREQHADECPAGSAIDGRTSLREAASETGVGGTELREN
ncbi:MAG: DUF4405 domain-containing protein [Myxococcales bacterium]|nr:DUF4405 domain-containing protein [Myxococcales bacterium]